MPTAPLALIVPFEAVRTLVALSTVQGSNVITLFTCGPTPEAYVLLVIVKMQEPNWFVPVAVPPVEVNVKLAPLLLKAKVVGTLSPL